MMGPCDGLTIEFIPVDRIKVLNPRERDRKKFLEIVDSIKKVGLKQPIKVTRVNGSGGKAEYGLVYGQGRLEAFIALGQKEIPAIVDDQEGRNHRRSAPARRPGAARAARRRALRHPATRRECAHHARPAGAPDRRTQGGMT